MRPICCVFVVSVFHEYVTGRRDESAESEESRDVMFDLSLSSDEQTSDVVVGLMSQEPVELVKRATMPLTEELPAWKVCRSVLVAIPMRPEVTGVMEGFPVVVA